MKMTIIILLSLILLNSCFRGDGYGDLIQYEVTDQEFIISGAADNKLFKNNIIKQKVIIPILGYDNSTIEIEKIDQSTKFKVNISFDGYNINKNEYTNWDWGGLPGNRPIPGISIFGGSGVGNMPMLLIDWDNETIRIFQHKNIFGIFIPMTIPIGTDMIFTMRGYENNNQKIYLSLVGGTSSGEYGGILVLMKKVSRKLTKGTD